MLILVAIAPALSFSATEMLPEAPPLAVVSVIVWAETVLLGTVVAAATTSLTPDPFAAIVFEPNDAVRASTILAIDTVSFALAPTWKDLFTNVPSSKATLLNFVCVATRSISLPAG